MASNRTRVKRSAVWSYYTTNDNDSSVKCKICDQSILSRGNTTNMWSHLKTHHPKNLENCSSIDEIDVSLNRQQNNTVINEITGTSASQSCSQQLIKDDNDQKSLSQSKHPPNSKLTEEINDALIEMIAIDLMPFEIVKRKRFRKFVNILNNKYDIPTERYLSTEVLTSVYTKVCSNIKKQLKEAENVHITIDHWSDTNREVSYVEITAHYIANNKLNHAALNVECFPQKSMTDNLTTFLINTIEDWEIDSKIISVVTDDDLQLHGTIDDIPWIDLPCFAHTLHTIIHGVLKIELVACIISKIRNIVHFFKNNNVASEALRNQQIIEHVEEPLSLKEDVPSRWNSVYLMIDRVLELRKFLLIVMTDLKENTPVVTFEDFELLQSIRNLLKPLFLATNEMCKEGYVSASKIIPIAHCLLSCIGKVTVVTEIEKLRVNLLTEIRGMFMKVEAEPIYALSTILDPRYKDVSFESTVRLEKAKKNILSHFDKNESDPTRVANDLWTAFDHKIKEKQMKKQPLPTAELELKRYLRLPFLNRQGDPIVWWNTKGNQFPKLKALTLQFLALPATSVPCERIFSKTGEILLRKRSMYDFKHMKMLTLIAMNNND